MGFWNSFLLLEGFGALWVGGGPVGVFEKRWLKHIHIRGTPPTPHQEKKGRAAKQKRTKGGRNRRDSETLGVLPNFEGILPEILRRIGDKFGSQAPPSFWEVPGLPRKFPELPRKFFGDFPGRSLTVELNSNPEVPRKFPKLPRRFPKLPRKFPDFPGGQPLSLGSLTPSPDSQKLSLRWGGLFRRIASEWLFKTEYFGCFLSNCLEIVDKCCKLSWRLTLLTWLLSICPFRSALKERWLYSWEWMRLFRLQLRSFNLRFGFFSLTVPPIRQKRPNQFPTVSKEDQTEFQP